VEPAALLYQAWADFESQSPKANENLLKIKELLTIAVNDCISAAAREHDTILQKSLLKVNALT
jgi:hypothetical protein